MGIVLHDGTAEIYQAYSGGKAWNDDDFLGRPPAVLAAYNTAPNITALLRTFPDRVMKTMVTGFQDLLNSENLNVWVV